jgi:hypothetical protein
LKPRSTLVRQYDTHRLLPSQYSEGGASVLARIASDDDLAAVFDLDNATNERLLAENNLLPGIGIDELVFGNAAFCHAHPEGSRFNGPERGVWYAGFARETAVAEVVFHKTVALAEVGRFVDEVTYDDYLADVSAELSDLRDAPDFADCLDPDSYVASQALAERLLAEGGLGVVYPSVRQAGGTCLALFRPAIVGNVRKGDTLRFAWDGSPEPVVT